MSGEARQGSLGPARRRSGFTLLEMLAVVLILALMATLVMPAVGSWSARRLKDEANRLANDLEYARQRTVMTGVPHRLLLDIDGAAWRVEWYVTEAEALGIPEEALAPAAGADPRRLDLTPPRAVERTFHPLPSEFGRTAVLVQGVEFAGVETPQGPVERGAVTVTFASDGTTDPATIVLVDEGGHRMALDLAPLDEVVGVRDAT